MAGEGAVDFVRYEKGQEVPFLYVLDPDQIAGDPVLELADSFAQDQKPGLLNLNGNVYYIDIGLDGRERFLTRIIPGKGATQVIIGRCAIGVPQDTRHVVFGDNGARLLQLEDCTSPVPDEIAVTPYFDYDLATEEEHIEFAIDLAVELERDRDAYFLGKYIASEYGDLMQDDVVSLHNFFVDATTGEEYDPRDQKEVTDYQFDRVFSSHTVSLRAPSKDEAGDMFIWEYSVSTPGQGATIMQLYADKGVTTGMIEETDQAGRRKSLKELDPEQINAIIRMVEVILNDSLFGYRIDELRKRKTKSSNAISTQKRDKTVPVSEWDEEERKMRSTGEFRVATDEEQKKILESMVEGHERIKFAHHVMRDLGPKYVQP